MLIFVQVYRTIEKNLKSSLGSGRTKKRAKESTKRKLKASEENCS